MAWTVEEGHVSCRRAGPARISACTFLTTLSSYFKHFPMQQLSTLLQIPSGSDCPHESLFKIGLNSNTRQSSSATKDSHYLNVKLLEGCLAFEVDIKTAYPITLHFFKHNKQKCYRWIDENGLFCDMNLRVVTLTTYHSGSIEFKTSTPVYAWSETAIYRINKNAGPSLKRQSPFSEM